MMHALMDTVHDFNTNREIEEVVECSDDACCRLILPVNAQNINLQQNVEKHSKLQKFNKDLARCETYLLHLSMTMSLSLDRLTTLEHSAC